VYTNRGSCRGGHRGGRIEQMSGGCPGCLRAVRVVDGATKATRTVLYPLTSSGPLETPSAIPFGRQRTCAGPDVRKAQEAPCAEKGDS